MMTEFFDRYETEIMAVVAVFGLAVVALDVYVWRAVL
jgi:hypothetical protein